MVSEGGVGGNEEKKRKKKMRMGWGWGASELI